MSEAPSADAAGQAAAEEDIRRRGGLRVIADESGFDFSGYWPFCRTCGVFCPEISWAIHAEWHNKSSHLNYSALSDSIRSNTTPPNVGMTPAKYVSAEALTALADALEQLGKVML